jgi:hypothetical protein
MSPTTEDTPQSVEPAHRAGFILRPRLTLADDIQDNSLPVGNNHQFSLKTDIAKHSSRGFREGIERT